MIQRNLPLFWFSPFVSLLFMTILASTVVAEENSKQKHTAISKSDLHKYQILTRVAYQIGKDDRSLHKGDKSDSMMTENGPIEASIDKLTPVAGTSTKGSEVQEVSCSTEFNWPEFPISKADVSIPIFLVLSCEDSKTGHIWTDYSRPELRIPKGQPSKAELSIGRRGSMKAGKYTITAMLFAKLLPESSLSLLDIKQTHFTVKAEQAASQNINQPERVIDKK